MAFQPTGIANIRTPLTYQDIYTPQQTRETANQSIAGMAFNPKWAAQKFGGQGQRTGAYQMAQAMPAITAAQAGMAAAMPRQQFEDDYANTQHKQRVGMGQFGDVMGQLGNVSNLQNPFGNNVMQQIMQLLMG